MNEPYTNPLNQNLTDLSGLNAHGTLGSLITGELSDPRRVTKCYLDCTVDGNFRIGYNGEYIPDTLGQHNSTRMANFTKENESTKVNVRPNPFKNSTDLTYKVEKNEYPIKVRLSITTLLGNEISVLVDKPNHEHGKFNATFNAETLPPGTYLYKLEIDGKLETGRLILMK